MRPARPREIGNKGSAHRLNIDGHSHGVRVMRGLVWAALVLAFIPQAAWAQGNDTETQTEQPAERGGEVQLGAGSTSNVTTGSSAAKPSASPGVAPLAVEMPRPQPMGPFGAMQPLQVQEPVALRCDIIADANAQARCMRQAPR